MPTNLLRNSLQNTLTLFRRTSQMLPSSSRRNDQMENTGDHERDGNTSFDQENIHNSDNQQKHGTMNMNYHSMQSSLTNTGTSTGMTKTWNETAERKLNSSRDACLKKGVMSRFIFFFPFYLPNRDSGSVGPLINTTAWRSHVIATRLHAQRFCFS